MPRRLQRYYGAGFFHFITTSCYHRRPLLHNPANRDLFLQVLEQVRRRYRFIVVGYVVMPEHVHVLISEPERANPSIVMQVLKQGFARRLLRRLRSHPDQSARRDSPLDEGRVWQRRFYDFTVWTDRKRIEKLRYMHRNPVKRGVVCEPDPLFPPLCVRRIRTGARQPAAAGGNARAKARFLRIPCNRISEYPLGSTQGWAKPPISPRALALQCIIGDQSHSFRAANLFD